MFTARHYLSLSHCLLVTVCTASHSFGADWIVKRSRYTHDPNTQARVTQYSPIGPFYANDMPNYQKSGYRQSRSSLQVGPSADHIHVVETWGQPVEPYGQWRYPYRPYSAPYQAWGPPYGGLNVGVGFGYFPPNGAFGGGGAGFAPGFGPGAGAGGGGPGTGPGMGPGGPGGGPGFGPGGGPGFGPGFGGGYGGGYSPSYGGGYGGNYYPPNNWTNPFNGPPGVDEYYPDAPSPSRLQPWGPRGF